MIRMSVPWFICWNLNPQCDGIRRQGLLHHEGGAHANETVVVRSPRRARPLCPSPSPKACPSSCPWHQWCHPAISSSDTLFSCPQSFPASGTFPMSQLLASGDQNTGVSTSASVLPMSIQGWFPLRSTDLFAIQGTFWSLLQHHSLKASILPSSAFLTTQLSRHYMATGKTVASTIRTFVTRVIKISAANAVSALIKETPESSLTLSPAREETTRKPLSVTWKRVLTRTRRVAPLILDFQHPELWEIDFCCLQATQSMVFCYSSSK